MAANDPRHDASSDALAPSTQQLVRLAGDLHDGLLQYVIAARMMTEALGRKLEAAGVERPPEVDSIEQLLQQAVAEGRQMIEQLHHGRSEEVDLSQALRRLAEALPREAGIDCQCQLPAELDLGEAASRLLHRLAQEATSNIRRHSHASSARLAVSWYPGGVQLEVADDGRGFDPTAVPEGHFGLSGMQRRVEDSGGELRIESRPGQGTRIVARIPVRR